MSKKQKPDPADDLPADFLQKLKSVTAKRARIAIDRILEHGFITTEELSTKYGYDYAPRAMFESRESRWTHSR